MAAHSAVPTAAQKVGLWVASLAEQKVVLTAVCLAAPTGHSTAGRLAVKMAALLVAPKAA